MWYERTTAEFYILMMLSEKWYPAFKKEIFAENFGQDTRKLLSSAALEAKKHTLR